MDDINSLAGCWDGVLYGEDYRRREADAVNQTARAFTEHLKDLITKYAGEGKNSIQINKKELYKGFIYPSLAKKVWLGLEKQNYGEFEQGCHPRC